MSRAQVLYEVCHSTPESEWEPMGTMYSDKDEAEDELRKKRPHYPTAFLARIVFTRVEKSKARRSLRTV